MLTVAALLAFVFGAGLAAALSSCQTQTRSNPISEKYPLNVTAVANGTFALVSLRKEIAASFLPDGFSFISDSHRSDAIGSRSDFIPLLIRALYVHDIRSPDDTHRGPHTVRDLPTIYSTS